PRWPRSTVATWARSTRATRRRSSPRSGRAGRRCRAAGSRTPTTGCRGAGGPEMEELRLMRHLDDPELATIDGYERFGGYRALRKALLEMEPDEVLHQLEESGLRGRGGAGFSMGKKASFLPKGS